MATATFQGPDAGHGNQIFNENEIEQSSLPEERAEAPGSEEDQEEDESSAG